MSTEDKSAADKKTVRPIYEHILKVAEYARTEYLVIAPAGSAPEDYLEPETYAHVVRKLRADDVLVVAAEDRSWRCEVLVLSCEAEVIHLAMLSKHEFAPIAGKEHDAYEPRWAGPKALFQVLRKSDRHVMVDKLPSKSAAMAWIEENGALKQAA